MKKTVQVRIGKQSFIMDDDAYKALSAYIDSLESHFLKMESGREVMDDLEQRMAEILSDALKPSRTVVELEDVEALKSRLGSPEELGDQEHEQEEAGERFNALAAGRRLMRDKDGAMIAGICNGMGAYFGLDPVLFRLLFVLMFFFTGIGLVAYLILWFVLPVAKTPEDKSRLYGNPMNLKDFERVVKQKAKFLEDEISDISRRSGKEWKDRLNRSAGTLSGFLGRIVNFAIWLAGTMLVLSGLFLGAFSIAMATGVSIIRNDMPYEHTLSGGLASLIGTGTLNTALTAVILCFLLIPALMLCVSGMSMMLGRTFPGVIRKILFTCGLIWIMSIASWMGLGIYVGLDFREKVTLRDFHTLPANELWIKEEPLRTWPSGWPVSVKVSWDVYSSDSLPEMEVLRSARGGAISEARERAERIRVITPDSFGLMAAPESFYLNEKELYRVQKMQVNLYLPEGYTLNLDQAMTEAFGLNGRESENYRGWNRFVMRGGTLRRDW